MKKIALYFALLLGVASLISCEDTHEREASPEANPSSNKVYFPEQLKGTVAIGVEQDTLAILLAREVYDAALTVNISITAAGSSAFTVPAVSFAAGDSLTTFNLSVEGDVEMMKTYLVELSVEASQTNPYMLNAQSPNLALNIVREDFVNIGVGQWTDGVITASYNAPVETYDVEVEHSEITGLYRVVNPYGFGIYPYTSSEEEVVRNPSYLLFDVSDPEDVTISGVRAGAGFGIGIDWGDGEFFIGLPADREEKTGGKLVDKTITFPGGSSLEVGEAEYNNGKAYGWCDDVILVLP